MEVKIMPKKSSVLKVVNQSYPNIMADIEEVLSSNDIQCKKSRSEIVAIDSKKKRVKNLISSLISKETDYKLLLDVVEAKGNVYIRKKCS
jgi:hypothetical protein